MADQDNEMTTDKVLIKRLASIGIKIDIDEKEIDRQMNPALFAINKKLKELTKENEKASKAGLFGSEFFAEKVKAFTGFDTALFKSTKTMMEYGLASKNMDVDNQEFYKSLGGVEKLLVKSAGLFMNKAKAQKDAAEQDKDNVGSTNELTAVLNQAENAITKIGPAAEEAGAGVEIFASVATFGLAAVAAAVVAIGVGFYKMFMQAVVARDEFKKFDQLFGGLGRGGVTEGIGQLAKLNKELWGLGMSLEQVNAVALESTKQGLNYHQSIQSDFVGPILELSGATGVAAGEIGHLYTELLKTTKIDKSSLANIGNAFIQFNQFAQKTGSLGQLSFAQFKTGIETSSNALAIATARGKEFTDHMIKDLATLSGLAQTLSLDIGALNSKFEEAGSMILNQESGFRNLLAISGGANINQMLSNQFDKTDAMLKGVTFLQEFNKSFGGNIQLTAQVAERSLGISKEMAIKMINMRQSAIDDMIKAQRDISGLQTDATKKAFENVNSDLSSKWNRVKTMFVTFFQNAFGSSSGMQRFLAKTESLLATLRNYMENAGWIKKLESIIDKVADWLGNHLTDIVEWIGKKLDEFSDNSTSNPLISLWDTIIAKLLNAAVFIGKAIGRGVLAGMTFGASELFRSDSSKEEASTINPMSLYKSPYAAEKLLLQNDVSRLDTEKARLAKYSPDTVTYGKKKTDGKVGFETIGQREFAIEKERKEKEAKLAEIRKKDSDNLEQIAKNTAIKQKEDQDKIGREVGVTSVIATAFKSISI